MAKASLTASSGPSLDLHPAAPCACHTCLHKILGFMSPNRFVAVRVAMGPQWLDPPSAHLAPSRGAHKPPGICSDPTLLASPSPHLGVQERSPQPPPPPPPLSSRHSPQPRSWIQASQIFLRIRADPVSLGRSWSRGSFEWWGGLGAAPNAHIGPFFLHALLPLPASGSRCRHRRHTQGPIQSPVPFCPRPHLGMALALLSMWALFSPWESSAPCPHFPPAPPLPTHAHSFPAGPLRAGRPSGLGRRNRAQNTGSRVPQVFAAAGSAQALGHA